MVDNIAKIPYKKDSEWKVLVSKKALKQTIGLPKNVLEFLQELLLDLAKIGPVQNEWHNFSKLTHGRFHCHLNYRYVAIWEILDKEIRIMEVTYVGSREGAPY